MTATKGTIGVLIEDHFDSTEYRAFNDYFPAQGYRVEYLSHLWGQDSLTFGSNPDDGFVADHVTVTVDVQDVVPADYAGIVCIGAYAMDRLRYQAEVTGPRANTAPAVEFIRAACAAPGVVVGAICHSLWLLCAAPELLQGRRVTCAHNIVCDVENAGAEVVYDGPGTADLVVDGDLVTAKHPDVTERFMRTFVHEIETSRGATMPTEQQIRDVVTAYVDSFNTRDRGRFVGLFTEDVVQTDPVGSPSNVGVPALAAFWDGLFGSVDKVEFGITDLIVTGDEAALSFHIVQTKPGTVVEVDGIDVFRVSADGRIAEVKGYADAAHIRISES